VKQKTNTTSHHPSLDEKRMYIQLIKGGGYDKPKQSSITGLKKHRAIPSRTLQQTVELQHTGEAHSVVTNLSGKMKSW
jgi:hypothetical protein